MFMLFYHNRNVYIIIIRVYCVLSRCKHFISDLIYWDYCSMYMYRSSTPGLYIVSQPQKIRSVTQKIALQMNCKMGGELWALIYN